MISDNAENTKTSVSQALKDGLPIKRSNNFTSYGFEVVPYKRAFSPWSLSYQKKSSWYDPFSLRDDLTEIFGNLSGNFGETQ